MIPCAAIAAALLAAIPGSTITATGTCTAPLRIPARDYADVTLIGNVAIGRMQAFFGHCNHTTYINNYAATLGFTHTITCSGGAGNVAIGNVLTNTPDAPHGPGSLKGFEAQWVARNTLWDARVQGWAPMPMGVMP